MSKKKQDKSTPEEELKKEKEPQQEQESSTGESADENSNEKDSATDKLNEQLKEEKDKFLRLAAEYDNYRKRTQKEREGTYREAQVDTITQFLSVYDNLERALAHETTDEAFCKGVEMIMTGFKEILGKMGVEEIPATGETFDPQLHNAVLHVEDDEKQAGEIVEELQKGFKIGDRVIRFSLVKVAN